MKAGSLLVQKGTGTFTAGAEATRNFMEKRKQDGFHKIEHPLPGMGPSGAPDGKWYVWVEVFHCPTAFQVFTDTAPPQALAPGWYWWERSPDDASPLTEPVGPHGWSWEALNDAKRVHSG